ncbi:hypothetical protein NUACC21_52040 [Scytonema sp. NUACC21]
MRLAVTDLFRAKWTEQIHSEWIRNVLKNRPDLTIESLIKIKDLMNKNVRDCLVTGYENLITGLELPDPDDRHVLAAAIRCHASVIVTFNGRDFPSRYLAPYGIESQHPDDFILHLIDLSPVEICEVAKKHRKALKNPAKTQEEYLETLLRQGLSQSVTTLQSLCHDI